jgi:2-oxoisovalerate dehydrogenase E1 component
MSLYPLDTEMIYNKSKSYGRILVLTEEPVNNSFAQSIAARIQQNCFEYLDAPVITIGSENMPAIPLNEVLEYTMLPNSEKLEVEVKNLLAY